MLCFKYSLPVITKQFGYVETTASPRKFVVVCAAKGPRPRYPRVWKSRKRIGTISKAAKLVECVKGLSNVKEDVYGALDSFIAWELEFPLITVKKALRALEREKEWKRIIQVTKWMLSKGQGRTMGSYFTLLNALEEDGRLEEAEELWMKIFSDNLEGTPRMFFDKMISIYYKRDMHEKIFEIFADMEELGVKPTVTTVSMVGDIFQRLDMLDKHEKLNKKYPPRKWTYRYIKGKRVRVKAQARQQNDLDGTISTVTEVNDDAMQEAKQLNDLDSSKTGVTCDGNKQELESDGSDDVSEETMSQRANL